MGLHVQVGLHIVRSFADAGVEAGWALLGKALLALPYGVFLPIVQLLRLRPGRLEGRAAVGLILAAALLPPAAALGGGADTTYPAVDGVTARAAASWLHAEWRGVDPGAPPDADGPVALVATAFSGSTIPYRSHVQRPSLAQALLALGRPDEDFTGLTLEFVTAEGALRPLPLGPERGVLLGAGDRGVRGPDRVLGAAELSRSPAVRARLVLPGVRAPVALLKGITPGAEGQHWFTTRGWIASDQGVSPMRRGWARGEAMSPSALVDAALQGGRQLLHNMDRRSGRFTYVVAGPSGRREGGYSLPRHAGAAWFLARLYSRTGDPEIGGGLADALRYLEERTEHTGDGRAYVQDPGRRDGLAWVGTTGLALLAFTEAGVKPQLQAAYAAHVATAVDGRGAVRGNYSVADDRWPEQPEITYAQGQGLLALAAAERAGVAGVSEALDRAADYADSGAYWPQPAARMGVLDEHWMCLAALALGELRGRYAGEGVCRAYVNGLTPPVSGGAWEPAAGAAAGLGEAVIALAEIERRGGVEGGVREDALQYGRWLLAQRYRPADAIFLDRPEGLLGGFRDRPSGPLDVRIDAVQHIACALLGVEQLLAGRVLPGATP